MVDVAGWRKMYPGAYDDMSDEQLSAALERKGIIGAGVVPAEEGSVLDDQPARRPGSRLEAAGQMFTDIPRAVSQEYVDTAKGIVDPIRNIYQRHEADIGKDQGFIERLYKASGLADLGDIGKTAMNAMFAAGGRGTGPAALGTAKSIFGHGTEAVMGPENVDYENVAGNVEKASMMLAPGKGGRKVPPVDPGDPVKGLRPESTFGVTLPDRSGRGIDPRDVKSPHAQEFQAETGRQLEEARTRVARGFDEFGRGQIHARNPTEAAMSLQRGIQRANAVKIENIEAGRNRTAALPGVIQPKAALNIAPSIYNNLATGERPIVISGQTPNTSAALETIHDGMMRALATNQEGKAAGVNLGSLEAIRTSLDDYHRKAKGIDRDGVARVIEEFSKTVSRQIQGNQFTGDERAVKAWDWGTNAAAEYRSTFRGAKGTPGEIIGKIVGDNPYDPKSSDRLADFFVGSDGVNPSPLVANVAREAKKLVGAPSPVWSGMKQGVFLKLTSPNGQEFKPLQISERITDFLKTPYSKVVYTPQDTAVLRQVSALYRQLEMPIAGDPSIVQQHMQQMARVGKAIIGRTGADLAAGHQVLVGRQRINDLNRALPLMRNEIAKYNKAIEKAAKSNSFRDRRDRYIATYSFTNAMRKLGIAMGQQGPPPPGMAEQGTKRDKLSFGGPGL